MMGRFAMKEDFEEKALSQFLASYAAGTARAILRSEKTPISSHLIMNSRVQDIIGHHFEVIRMRYAVCANSPTVAWPQALSPFCTGLDNKQHEADCPAST
eukprot:scaffold790_cov387-Prasinococcus_capsulatus_cf.AAC.10